MTGIFPGIKMSFGEMFKMIPSESEFAHNSFYGDDKEKYKLDNYVETVDLNNNEELKNIIEKIRVFLEKNRTPFASEFNAKHSGIFDNLETEPDLLDLKTHKYEDFSDDVKAPPKMKDINTLAELVFKILTKPNYVSTVVPPVTFDRTEFNLSTEELNILIPKYYNTFVYSVGQNFNIFSPPDGEPPNISFYEAFDKLLAKLPMSLVFSFGNRELMVKSFFNSTVVNEALNKFVESGKKEETEGYYVGELNAAKQKAGAGVMRWNNKNIFEGTFVNDSIADGMFTVSDDSPKSLKMTDAKTGQATLDAVAGTFDSVSGVFISGSSSAGLSSAVVSVSSSAVVSVSSSASSASSASSDTDLDKSISKIKKALNTKYGNDIDAVQNLNTTFSGKVVSGNLINLKQFAEVLNDLNLGLSNDEIKLLFIRAAPDRDDLINYENFINVVTHA